MYLNKIKKSLVKENIWLLILASAFFLSVLLYLGSHFTRERIILYFPDSVNGKLEAEYRVLPREHSRVDRISQLVEETILGPANIRSFNIFQRNTRLLSVFIRPGGLLVVDLDREALTRITDKDLTLRQSMEILQKIIQRNFPAFRQVEILVNGQIPFVPPYTPASE